MPHWVTRSDSCLSDDTVSMSPQILTPEGQPPQWEVKIGHLTTSVDIYADASAAEVRVALRDALLSEGMRIFKSAETIPGEPVALIHGSPGVSLLLGTGGDIITSAFRSVLPRGVKRKTFNFMTYVMPGKDIDKGSVTTVVMRRISSNLHDSHMQQVTWNAIHTLAQVFDVQVTDTYHDPQHMDGLPVTRNLLY